jgi:hypothetical protein
MSGSYRVTGVPKVKRKQLAGYHVSFYRFPLFKFQENLIERDSHELI